MENLSKEQIQNIFNQIDSNKNGTLSREEIAQLGKTLKIEISQSELTNLFSIMDIDKDGQVTFEEFYDWWYYGKQSKLTDLLKFKMKALKAHKKFDKYVDKKFGKIAQQEPAQQKREINIGVSIGDEPMKSEIRARLESGQFHSKTIEKLAQGLNLPAETPFLSIQFGTKNAEQQKKEFEEIFEQLQSLLVSMAPEEFAGIIENNIKIKFSIPEQNLISIGFVADHDLINQAFQDYFKTYDNYFSDDMGQQFTVSSKFSVDLGQIGQNFETGLGQIKSKSAQFKFEGQLSQNFHQKIREIALNRIKSFVQQQKDNDVQMSRKNKKKYLTSTLLTLLDSAHFHMKISDSESDINAVAKAFGFKDGFGNLNFLELLKKGNSKEGEEKIELQSLIDEIPIIQQIIDTFKNYGSTEFKIFLNLVKANFQFEAQSQGAEGIIELLLKTFQ